MRSRWLDSDPTLVRPAQLPASRIILGAYLYAEAYPEPLAGHIFVAIETPRRSRRAYGFSPRNFGRYDPHRDLDQLTVGVSGVVHDDEGAFKHPGVKLRLFAVGDDQVSAALARVKAYQSGMYRFSLEHRQCSAFALDVLRAARVTAVSGPLVQLPREIYNKL